LRRFARNIKGVVKRELAGYFGSPVAYVFIVVFLLLCGFFTFYISHFYEVGQADLRAFFEWHPWIFLFLVPAVGMRLWAEERRTGTIEIILTLPITLPEIILGKFIAAWLFIGMALFLTFPLGGIPSYTGVGEYYIQQNQNHKQHQQPCCGYEGFFEIITFFV